MKHSAMNENARPGEPRAEAYSFAPLPDITAWELGLIIRTFGADGGPLTHAFLSAGSAMDARYARHFKRDFGRDVW
jgi:hypothetical protein